jgi:hypothetical protein
MDTIFDRLREMGKPILITTVKESTPLKDYARNHKDETVISVVNSTTPQTEQVRKVLDFIEINGTNYGKDVVSIISSGANQIKNKSGLVIGQKVLDNLIFCPFDLEHTEKGKQLEKLISDFLFVSGILTDSERKIAQNKIPAIVLMAKSAEKETIDLVASEKKNILSMEESIRRERANTKNYRKLIKQKKILISAKPKTLEDFKREISLIKSLDFVKSVRMTQANLIVKTKSMKLKDVDIGTYTFTVSKDFKIKGKNDVMKGHAGHNHCHITHEGDICFGEANNQVDMSLRMGELYQVFNVLGDLLETPYEHNAYCSIDQFLTEFHNAKDNKPMSNCHGCGRIVVADTLDERRYCPRCR